MQQYYVAVGCASSKLVTLQDLLAAITDESDSSVRVGVCCSSRDTCDEVLFALTRVRCHRFCTRLTKCCTHCHAFDPVTSRMPRQSRICTRHILRSALDPWAPACSAFNACRTQAQRPAECALPGGVLARGHGPRAAGAGGPPLARR